jgi:mycofactocin biosynthetic radical S-adenosylmethionine protein MftC
MSASSLVDQMKQGLDAPICLTWELTYACNLECVHCLSSSGRRDPRELTTDEAKAVLDELRALQVFYINIGGGEPMVRRDFFELVEYAIGNDIGVKFSTNGAFIDADKARRLASMDYLDIQISLDGTDAVTNDAVRGTGSYDMARRAMDHLADAGFGPFKISVVVTRHNVDQLDEFKALADGYGAQLRVTRLRPSGGAPIRGTTSTPPTPSNARSTSGCSPTARTCSPATRSSTSMRSASRCPASTCAARGGSCASSTRSATCMPVRS